MQVSLLINVNVVSLHPFCHFREKPAKTKVISQIIIIIRTLLLMNAGSLYITVGTLYTQVSENEMSTPKC